MSQTANRIIKNTGYLYAKMSITMFVSLYTTRLILNTLGASDFGIYNIVGGAIAMLGFLNIAMASTTQRFMSYSEGEGNKDNQKVIFNVSVVLHITIALVFIILLLIAGYFFFNGILNIPSERTFAAKVVYGSLIFSTALTVMNVPYDAVMNAHENMYYYAFVGVLESFLKLLVAYVCIWYVGDKLIAYGVLMALIPVITLSIMKIYCHKHYRECHLSLRKYWSTIIFKKMLSFAGWNLFSTAAAMITNSGVGIVMNNFFGTIVNAAQGIANQICGQLLSITNAMSKAVNPVITKAEGAKDHNRVIKMSMTSSKAYFFLISFIALPAIVTMPELLRIWLKKVPDFAVFFAQCQLVIALCEQLTNGFNSAITASGKIKEISLIKSISKFSFLPISFLLFKMGYSVIVAYLILIIIQGVINGLLVPVIFTHKIFNSPLKMFLKKIIFPVLVVCVCVLCFDCILKTFTRGYMQIVITFPLSIILYTICFYLVVLDESEKEIVTTMLQKVKLYVKHDKL